MKLIVMKHFSLLVLVATLFACNHETQDQSLTGQSLRDQNLSGTWLFTQHDAHYHKQTGDYLYTNIIETTIIIEDDPLTGTLYYECWDTSGTGNVAIKSETHLYINGNATAFRSIGVDALETAVEEGIEYNFIPDLFINQSFRLEKLTSDVITDKGSFTLNGPISVSESNNVCVSHHYSDIYPGDIYDLMIPYDNDWLYMRIEMTTGPSVGVHNYTPFQNGAEIINFDISSNSANFWSVTGTNSLYPSAATIDIATSTDNVLAGSFSFTGVDSGSYTGEFIMDTTN